MAHFAQLDENNIVTQVVVVSNDQEHRGQDFLANDLGLGGHWEKTSYNTRGGVYYDPSTNLPADDQSKAYRKNYAGIGYSYDEVRNAFIPPRPFESWIINEDTCLWESPIPYPEDENIYTWDESTQNWAVVEPPAE